MKKTKTFVEKYIGRASRPAHLPHTTESCAPDAGYPIFEQPTKEAEYGTITVVPDGEGGLVQEPFVPDATPFDVAKEAVTEAVQVAADTAVLNAGE